MNYNDNYNHYTNVEHVVIEFQVSYFSVVYYIFHLSRICQMIYIVLL